MNFTTLQAEAGAAWARAEAFLLAHPEIAGVGVAAAIGLAAALLIAALVWLARAFALMLRRGVAARIRRMTDSGARVLVVGGRPGRQRAIARWLKRSADTHLKAFMFGGPFRVLKYPGSLEGDAAATRLLKRTEADLILWAETPRGARSGVVRILARPGNPFEPDRTPLTLAMPREPATWGDPLSRATAYAAAKEYRPALGRPQDFRPERLKPVVEMLLNILGYNPKADPRLVAEMVDNAAAGALQLAVAGEEGWLDRAVDIATTTLGEIDRSETSDRWIAAKITLGRALRLRAEHRFDPVLLRESIAHLNEALEALRNEPRFHLAESAAASIGEAQRMLGARRKFSISGGGI